ncbi:MAG: hypothetical protein R2834_07485 [Rhodothermales bacterium]
MVAIPILLVIFGFVGFIVKWAMDHEQEKLRIKAGQASQDTLTESDLRGLIREVVEEAIEPLRERLDRLESGSGEAPEDPVAELPEAGRSGRLDVFETEEDVEEPASSRPRHRTR